jgi:hypothetical protein
VSYNNRASAAADGGSVNAASEKREIIITVIAGALTLMERAPANNAEAPAVINSPLSLSAERIMPYRRREMTTQSDASRE